MSKCDTLRRSVFTVAARFGGRVSDVLRMLAI
jgi:hypothetical protein